MSAAFSDHTHQSQATFEACLFSKPQDVATEVALLRDEIAELHRLVSRLVPSSVILTGAAVVEEFKRLHDEQTLRAFRAIDALTGGVKRP